MSDTASSSSLQGPGRILGEEPSISVRASQTSRPAPQPGVRRRHQGSSDTETRDKSSEQATHASGQEFQLPNLQHAAALHANGTHYGDTILIPTPNNAESVPRSLRMMFPDGTEIRFEDGREGFGLEVVPEIIRELSNKGPSAVGQGADRPNGFPEHYISLAPLPQFRNLDTATYLLSKDHHNDKSTSKLKVPNLYKGYDVVTNTTARVILFLIADKCQFLDNCMAELFKAMLPKLPRDVVEQQLSRAKAMIVESDPSQSPPSEPSAPERRASRSPFLGELGHYLESVYKGEPHDFMTHRVGERRLDYLQDALELPYWDMIVDLFEVTSNTKRASGVSQTIMENVVAGCYQFINSHLQHLKNLYANGEIDEAVPKRILEGIDLRLHVLEKYTSAVDPLRQMEAILATESCKKQNEVIMEEPVPVHGDQVLTFSILFVVLAIAMVPGMMGFAKAAQDGEIGSTYDADFAIVIRDTIMTILSAALSAVQMIKSPRKNSAYRMAWVFSGLGVSLGVVAIIVYPLANKGYSSLCGFFAQFFSIASLAILVLDGPGSAGKGATGRVGVGDGGVVSQERKDT